MDGLRKRLECSNVFIQRQAAGKVLAIIKEKCAKKSTITSSKQMKELMTLWELCNSRQAALFSCKILLELIYSEHADPDYVLDGLINSISTSSNVQSIIEAIIELFEYLSFTSGNHIYADICKNPNQHPYVKMIQSAPEYWPLLMEKGKIIEAQSASSSNYITMLPVFSYVFGFPKFSHHISRFKQDLCLLLPLDDPHSTSIISLCLNWSKSSMFEDVMEHKVLLQRIVAKLEISHDVPQDINMTILVECVSFCKTLAQFQLDCGGFLSQSLRHLLGTIKKQNVDLLLVILCEILIVSPGLTDVILNAGAILMSAEYDWSSFSASLWMFTLLQINVSKSSFKSEKVFAHKAKDLITKIEANFSKKHSNQNAYNSFVASAIKNQNTSVFVRIDTILKTLCQNTSLHQIMKTIDLIEQVSEEFTQIFNLLPHLLCATLLHHLWNLKVVEKCLKCIVKLISLNCDESPGFLPFLMYCLNRATIPEVKLMILESLPSLGTTKFAIGPLVKTLEVLSHVPRLKHVALKVMTTLWTKNDRCFAYLLDMLSNTKVSNFKKEHVGEVLLSKAASILTICEHSCSTRGEEMLPMMSALLNDKNSPAAVCALALRGIRQLCKAEVIDIQTTWQALHTRLKDENNHIIIRETCELLALTPDLQVQTKSYENFMDGVVDVLWKYVKENSSREICGAAYRALSRFNQSLYNVKHLPDKVKQQITDDSSTKQLNPDEVSTVPGTAFTALLLSINDSDLLADYSVLLCSLVFDELQNLPSLAYFPKSRHKQQNKSKSVLSSIPELFGGLFHSQNHAMKDNIAFGMLLTYKSDEEMSDVQLMRKAKEAQHLLSEIITNLALEISNWRRFIFVPNAWMNFMNKLFTISIDGRKAELRLQKSKGKLNASEEDFEKLMIEIPLWVRDRLVDILKTSARGRSSCQGNAIIALACLLSVSSNYFKTIGESERDLLKNVTERLPQKYWETVVIETIMFAINPKHKTSEETFNWLKNSSTVVSGDIVGGAGVIALTIVMPFIPNSSERNGYFMKLIVTPLLAAESDCLVHFYHGIALGMYIPQLYQYCGVEISDLRLMHKLRTVCFSENDMRDGKFAGLITAVDYLCRQPNQKSVDFIKSLHGQLMSNLKNESQVSLCFEPLSICTATTTVLALIHKCVTMASAEHLLVMLDERRQEIPNCRGTSSALGILVRGFLCIKHKRAEVLKSTLMQLWLPVLANEDSTLLSRVAALYGLASLFGLESSLYQIPESFNVKEINNGLSDFLSLLTKIIKLSSNIGLKNACLWISAQIYCVNTNRSSFADPLSYSYLSEQSILKPISLLLGQPKDLDKEHLKTCLKSISQPFLRPLPPLDWNSLLSPIMHENDDPEMLKYCLLILIRQYKSSLSAQNILNPYFTTSVLSNIDTDLQIFIIENLPAVCTSIQLGTLRQFMMNILFPIICNAAQTEFHLTIFQVLLKMMKISEPPQGFIAMVQEFIAYCYKYIIKNTVLINNATIRSYVCELLTELPTTTLDVLFVPTDDDMTVPFLLKLELIGVHSYPISTVTSFIDHAHKCNEEAIIHHTFMNMRKVEDSTRDQLGINWILDYMSKIHQKSKEATTSASMLKSLLIVFVTTVVAWSNSKYHSLISDENLTLEQILLVFPSSLISLLERIPWINISMKMLDWLVLLKELKCCPPELKCALLQIICMSKQLKQFQSNSNWLKIVMSTFD